MAVGVALLSVVAFVVSIGLVMGGATAAASSQASTGGAAANLNVAAIPAAMQSVVPYVVKAGALCPAVSAPQIAAQIDTESAWDPHAVSSAGAEGLAQFLPSTWPAYGRTEDGTHNVSPFDPNDAAVAMGRYDCANAATVAPLVAEGKGTQLSLMLAAYDGPAAVLAAGGVPAAAETYVATVEHRIPTYTAPAAVGSGFGALVLAEAERELGVPYVWGGGNWTGPAHGGFDCSGLVMFAIAQASGGQIRLPHSSEIQATMGNPVPVSALVPGDVIAFALNTASTYDHIGIVAGNGQIIDAPHTGAVVRYDPLSAFAGHPWAIRSFG